jgi:tetratricopeptide (TPR) repeat protein
VSANVVEGSVRRAGDRVRITAQLIKAADGFQVWSNQFERDVKDIFAVQEEIAGLIAQALQLRLATTPAQPLASGATRNPAAYEAFLKGRQAWNETSAAGDREAVDQFLRALELDPDFALAHGALAEAYVSLANDGVEPAAKVFPLARASAERALALDDGIVQAHTALAEYAFHFEWDYEKSDRYLKRALEVDPNYSVAYTRLAGHLNVRNRIGEALAASRRSRELNPLGRNIDVATDLIVARRYDEALRMIRDELSANKGKSGARVSLGLLLSLTGKNDEAIATLEAMVAESPDSVAVQEMLGWAYGRAGEKDKARAVLQRLTAIAETRYVSPLGLASVSAGLDDRDLAFAQLERAFELHEPQLPTIGIDPTLEPIRDDPRFRAMLTRLKLDIYFPVAK